MEVLNEKPPTSAGAIACLLWGIDVKFLSHGPKLFPGPASVFSMSAAKGAMSASGIPAGSLTASKCISTQCERATARLPSRLLCSQPPHVSFRTTHQRCPGPKQGLHRPIMLVPNASTSGPTNELVGGAAKRNINKRGWSPSWPR